MHHEVANLKLLDLLQCQSHLATAGLVALEIVFMETVEDLVVGKHADTQVVVGKTLVESLLNGSEGYFRLFDKNIFQTLILLLTVCTDIYLVALQQIVLKGLYEQVEVLMEERLHGDVKVKNRSIRHGRTVSEFYASELKGITHELWPRDQLRLAV